MAAARRCRELAGEAEHRHDLGDHAEGGPVKLRAYPPRSLAKPAAVPDRPAVGVDQRVHRAVGAVGQQRAYAAVRVAQQRQLRVAAEPVGDVAVAGRAG